ncbi:MAG: type II 3-dehydroquinate dehydratase [Gammaproteobacteria bacterium 39-13]|nr:type II 3-dehydroquinate dehydratase [Gammaproteobacteria bacterium]OJV85642.1 MAG: type II 3-dehydroquinate dehydratase [Gammaproteobacteria bacterium 39-13]
MAKILVIHGPNLNLLGKREPSFYGKITLKAINQHLTRLAKGHDIECYQSNAEHEIVAKIQACAENATDVIIINPAAFTHTSIALRDSLLAVNIPFFEVHLSNIHAREIFRHHSYLSDIAVGVVSGLGAQGYYAALNAALETLS